LLVKVTTGTFSRHISSAFSSSIRYLFSEKQLLQISRSAAVLRDRGRYLGVGGKPWRARSASL